MLYVILSTKVDLLPLQALLTDWHTMVTTVTTLTNQASVKMDAQVVAMKSLQEAMIDTLTSMKESTTFAARLLDQYVSQNAMLATATGQTETVNCSRGAVFEAHFSVNRYDVNSLLERLLPHTQFSSR